MKIILKSIVTASIIALIAAGCSKKDIVPAAPVTPELSASSVTVEAGKSITVNITKGTPKYTAVSSSTSVATATVNGNTVTVAGISEGTATVTVSGSDGGKAGFTVSVSVPDPYEMFKADETPRFETDGQKTVKNADGEYLFYLDAGVNLFSSAKTKTGYASRDGKTLYFIEWESNMAQGEKSNPTLRTGSGTVVSLQYLRILQVKNGKIWITYKLPDSSERRAVQPIE